MSNIHIQILKILYQTKNKILHQKLIENCKAWLEDDYMAQRNLLVNACNSKLNTAYKTIYILIYCKLDC